MTPKDAQNSPYMEEEAASKQEKTYYWDTGIGLQEVDGLKPSAYLLKTAQKNINGEIDIEEADALIRTYYEQRKSREDYEASQEEADVVSARIVKVLSEKAFTLSPVELFAIHRKLFEGIVPYAGQPRPYNITKKEWVLDGDTVRYAPFEDIRATLDYDFDQEKKFHYADLTQEAFVAHFSEFIAGVWQIHPFLEGNTRTTAVFAIKYLRTLGFKVEAGDDPFKEYSWYFRNALVRANYDNFTKHVHRTTKYLEAFFDNLLFSADNELKNRDLKISS